MKARLVLLTGCILALPLRLASAEQAQWEGFRLSGVLEHYFRTYSDNSHLRFGQHARYLHLRGQVSPAVGFAAGMLEHSGIQQFDENYLEVHRGNLRWRIGRFRAAYGHSDWSECYYTGFARTPLLRDALLGASLRLNRLDTGMDVSGGTGPAQYQVGWIDARSGSYDVLSLRPDHLVARVQLYQDNLIVGLSALLEPGASSAKGTRLFGLDWRWSIPYMQIRGEFVKGNTSTGRAQGYYLDLFYHPPGLERTTFLARAEAITSPVHDVGTGELYTVGVKQVISPLLTLSLTHGWGSGESARGARGWVLQMITFTRF